MTDTGAVLTARDGRVVLDLDDDAVWFLYHLVPVNDGFAADLWAVMEEARLQREATVQRDG